MTGTAEYSIFLEVFKSLGVTGLIVLAAWKFGTALLEMLKSWAPQFLKASQDQAAAMAALAQAVRDGQGEQREVLLAVRVMATKVDEMRGTVETLDRHIRKPAEMVDEAVTR